jgi:ubiquinone/menaquinone biosynthesis C-methylase UbiE
MLVKHQNCLDFEPFPEFYKGRWTSTDYSNGSLRNYLIKKQRFFIRQLQGKRGKVADLGCGGGWKFFARIGSVIGIDLSFPSLQNAKQVYNNVVQADVAFLPFIDNSFDVVVSSDLLGHIPLDRKDQVLLEIYRVLKPGGLTVHYVETFSNDPLSAFARKYPDLYQRYIIAPEGHIGIETVSKTMERFRRVGFVPVHEVAAYKGFVYLQRFIQYFDNEYKEKSSCIRLLVTLFKLLSRVNLLTNLINLGITLCFEILDPVLPTNWAGGVLLCYTKIANHASD